MPLQPQPVSKSLRPLFGSLLTLGVAGGLTYLLWPSPLELTRESPFAQRLMRLLLSTMPGVLTLAIGAELAVGLPVVSCWLTWLDRFASERPPSLRQVWRELRSELPGRGPRRRSRAAGSRQVELPPAASDAQLDANNDDPRGRQRLGDRQVTGKPESLSAAARIAFWRIFGGKRHDR